ncbi:MAG: cysteine dioxygenase family protein [Cyanobacteriota bacterium]|nr:cysteine dioxygenase family protein [Cyanobacteriota bacterium]
MLNLVRTADVRPADLEPWADYGHAAADSYGRRMIVHGGHYEVMVMTWLPGDVSAIHDHGSAEWGAVQCFGRALHDTFRLSSMRLSVLESLPYRSGDLAFVDASMIHQMGNTGRDAFLSLHIYGCRQSRPLITTQARVFDLDLGEIQYTDGGVFYALPEERILKRKTGLQAPADLVARQRILKRARLERMVAAAA